MNHKRLPMQRFAFWACAMLTASRVEAGVKPAAIFTDNAVLQRDMSFPIWGTATDGQKITVEINGQTVTTTTVNGKWMTRLKPMSSGGPFTMTITGENTIQLK